MLLLKDYNNIIDWLYCLSTMYMSFSTIEIKFNLKSMLNVHNVLTIEIKLEIFKKLKSENIKFAKVYNIGKYTSIAIKKQMNKMDNYLQILYYFILMLKNVCNLAVEIEISNFIIEIIFYIIISIVL